MEATSDATRCGGEGNGEGGPCDLDDGEPCDDCRASMAAESVYYRWYFGGSVHSAHQAEYDPEGYTQTMRDEGRRVE